MVQTLFRRSPLLVLNMPANYSNPRSKVYGLMKHGWRGWSTKQNSFDDLVDSQVYENLRIGNGEEILLRRRIHEAERGARG
jgi:hypothetical protein